MKDPALSVWQVDLRRPAAWLAEACESLLPATEAERRPDELDDAWRRRVVSRAALRGALARRLGREPASLPLRTGPDGRPELLDGGAPAIHFSLSHSGETCVVGVSEDAPVGVDLEQVRERAHLERLVETRLAAAEAEQILRLDGDERLWAFYRVWTRKEAYLKATGLGLRAKLDSFAVTAGPRAELLSPLPGGEVPWSLHDLGLGDGFCGALAIKGSRRDAGGSIRPAAFDPRYWSDRSPQAS